MNFNLYARFEKLKINRWIQRAKALHQDEEVGF